MKAIWRIIRHDARQASQNAITLVVIIGMIVVPSFYAWFNIAGSWDPYGNTKNLEVAVANNDRGYEGALVPVKLDLGDRIVDRLRASESIGYVATTEEDAREGVRSGAYYASLIIPEDFSERLLTGFSTGADAAEVTFLQNQKANAIAEIVTDKAANAVRADIDQSFAAAVTDVGAGALDELSSTLDDNEVASVAGRLDQAVVSAGAALRGAAGDARSYAGLLSSCAHLLGSGGDALDAAGDPALTAAQALDGTAAGVRDVADALAGASSALDDALDAGSSAMDDVSAAIDRAFTAAGAQTKDLTSALTQAKAIVDEEAAQVGELSSALDAQIALARELAGKAEAGSALAGALNRVVGDLESVKARVTGLNTELSELSGTLEKTAGDLAQGATDAKAAHEELDGLVSDAAGGLSALRGTATQNAISSLDALAAEIDRGATDAQTLAQSLSGTLDAVDNAATSASDAVADGSSTLTSTADALEAAAAQLDELHGRLSDALASEDVSQIRQILSAGPSKLAAFMASPVVRDRTAVFPVENNGSAMAPFYTTLAIWIGGVVLAALTKIAPSSRTRTAAGASIGQAYVGRLAFFAAIGLAQASLICAGDLYYLGVQCAHPLLFFATGWLASFVFVNIIFALTAAFGDVGKAVAVVLMVIQVAGSGGTFPPQMLPEAFQVIYRWLPFVHAEDAFRAAMFGIYGGDYGLAMGRLAAYLVPALILGLILRRHLARANGWIEHRLEDTRVM